MGMDWFRSDFAEPMIQRNRIKANQPELQKSPRRLPGSCFRVVEQPNGGVKLGIDAIVFVRRREVDFQIRLGTVQIQVLAVASPEPTPVRDLHAANAGKFHQNGGNHATSRRAAYQLRTTAGEKRMTENFRVGKRVFVAKHDQRAVPDRVGKPIRRVSDRSSTRAGVARLSPLV